MIKLPRLQRVLFMFLALLVFGAQSASVAAITLTDPAEIRALYNEGPFYSSGATSCEPGEISASTAPAAAPNSTLATAVQVGAFDGSQITPSAIILHWTAGTYGSDPQKLVDTLRGRVETGYPNGRAVQLTVNKQGTVYQLSKTLETMPIQTMAQEWNNVSIGIEIESDSFPTIPEHEQDLMNNSVQYASVLGLVKDLMAKYSIKNEANTAAKKGVFGHYEANTGHSDPGANFMAKVRTDLNNNTSPASIAPQASNSANVCCSPSSPASADASLNQAPIFGYLIGKSLPPVQAAAIMGNMQAESHFEPRLVEYTWKNSRGEISEPGKPSSLDTVMPPIQGPQGQPGYGIVQWTSPGRRAGLQAMADGQKKLASDLTVQLDYLWKELNEGYKSTVLDPMRATSDLREATEIFLKKFESPRNQSDEVVTQRTENAQTILGTFGSQTPSGPTGSVGGCGGSVSVDGYSFPVAPQTKSGNSKISGLSPIPCNSQTACHHDFFVPESYAFDIGRQPGGDSSAGAPVYAISDGTIKRAHNYSYSGEEIPGCYQLQLVSSKDNFWYWYGHLGNMTVKDGDVVTAGQQIAEIGERRCTGNGSLPHLHIDRGCVENGTPKPGGSPSCRDEGIIPLINKLFEALPE